MRIIWPRDFDKLLKENLTEEERQRYKKSFDAPISSFEEMKQRSDIQLRLFLKAIRCSCVKDFFAFRDESLDIARQVFGGDVTRYFKERVSPEYKLALQRLSRNYARKRRCHLNLRAAICYCDEHVHQ